MGAKVKTWTSPKNKCLYINWSKNMSVVTVYIMMNVFLSVCEMLIWDPLSMSLKQIGNYCMFKGKITVASLQAGPQSSFKIFFQN